jgi:alkyldihydroxyacetonephosphate synthase
MHPTRWGDPSRAAALSPQARGLVELVFTVADRTVAEGAPVTLPPPALPDDVLAALVAVVGPEHVLT